MDVNRFEEKFVCVIKHEHIDGAEDNPANLFNQSSSDVDDVPVRIAMNFLCFEAFQSQKVQSIFVSRCE